MIQSVETERVEVVTCFGFSSRIISTEIKATVGDFRSVFVVGFVKKSLNINLKK